MDNLELYNKVRVVPNSAQKPITGGRLKGMTDINPMWRIKVLTEQFGMCGVGWYFEPFSTRVETAGVDAKESVVTVEGNLFVKVDGEWSKPIYGIGGAKLVSMEKNGAYVDDEAFKKANTDALSVACKSLGIGADVYWDKDTDKYIDPKKDNYSQAVSMPSKTASTANSNGSTDSNVTDETKKLTVAIKQYADAHGITMKDIAMDFGLNNKTATASRLTEVLDVLKALDEIDAYAKEHQMTLEEVERDYAIDKRTVTVQKIKDTLDMLKNPPSEDEFAGLDEKLPF